jgi:O-antigen ligase
METLDLWLRSNPSIASGSEELYLGHAFVGIARVRGTFPEPLLFGSYLVVATPIAWVVGGSRRGRARAWRWLAAAAGLTCLLLTFSRGAYLGAAIVVAVATLEMARGRIPRPSARAGALLVGGGFVGVAVAGAMLTGQAPWELPGLLARRLVQSLADHDMSNLTRLHAWRAAAQMTAEQPITGVGWGGFGFHYFRVAGEVGSGAHFGWPVPNSFPLLIAAETGLVGLCLWGRAFWPAFCGLTRLRGQMSSKQDVLAWGLAVLCSATLAQGLTFSQWNLPHLWILAGFSAFAGRRGWSVV